MASTFFRQFAIDNNLTVDYGYMYGLYKGFYISLKETLGSTKILTINTTVGQDKEKLKTILSIFTQDELPKYCITDMKRDDKYLQFTFEIVGSAQNLIVEFLDKFIESSVNNQCNGETICPICNKLITKEDKISIVDYGGFISPMHEECYENKKEEKKKEENKSVVETIQTGSKGLLGSFVFSLIYFGILILSFFFIQFILANVDNTNAFVLILQYLPSLVAFAGAPIISKGYDVFKGPKGSTKYIVVFWFNIITTLLGTFFGFVASLLLVTDNITFVELLKLVGNLITCKEIQGSQSFRWGFYLYIIIALIFAVLSMVITFSTKKEREAAESKTFDKLD